jgi:hypothetical protein
VAAAPPGFREATLSDYSLSVSEGGLPEQEPRGLFSRFWPRTQTGMLLAIGAVGVTLIAATMSFQKGREDKKSGQTLVTPSAVVTAAPTAEPTSTAVVKPPPAPPAADTSTAKPTTEAASKSERDDSHKAHSHEPTAPNRIDRPREKAPSGPARPKNVDFGI